MPLRAAVLLALAAMLTPRPAAAQGTSAAGASCAEWYRPPSPFAPAVNWMNARHGLGYLDGGRTWTPDAGHPVLDRDLANFRGPRTPLSDFGPAGAVGGIREGPGLFLLPADPARDGGAVFAEGGPARLVALDAWTPASADEP